ncbi:hypothetical protein R3W88_029978 [Solanum pinnatisectum]|uniref:AP2/ERF domain-containing protein n=1 Tax=Solanum pinnatisectum TaxID=50273 RepID=A0AAV9K7B5_9SOLN|nr:hypothetical protein R3W88_029978 [Solanum pinnatisectum]
MPRRRYKADIKDPVQRISVWLNTFDASEKAARAYDTVARRYHSHKANASDDNNDNSNHMLPIQTTALRSSFEQSCGGANNSCSIGPLNLEITLAPSKSINLWCFGGHLEECDHGTSSPPIVSTSNFFGCIKSSKHNTSPLGRISYLSCVPPPMASSSHPLKCISPDGTIALLVFLLHHLKKIEEIFYMMRRTNVSQGDFLDEIATCYFSSALSKKQK